MLNIYVPQNYKPLSHDNNIITLLNLVYAKISRMLDELEIEYTQFNSLYDRHNDQAILKEYQFNDLQLLNKLGNSELSRKVLKDFDKTKHEEAVKRLALTPEYIYEYYRYLAYIIIESQIKTSKFINNFNDKNKIIQTCLRFIAKNINNKNDYIKEIDEVLSLLLFDTVVI